MKPLDQILILIPNASLFWDVYKNGLMRSISNTILRDVTVKILIHLEENQISLKNDICQKLKGLTQDLEINTNFFFKKIPEMHISLIVDNAVLVEVANNDTNNEDANINANFLISNAPLTASFSINETKISSSMSIFDILWIQSDFERQKKD